MQPFHYQKSSTKRDTNMREVEGQPQQIQREHSKFQGKQRVLQILHSHITSDFTNKELRTAVCNKTGEKHFSSATFLFLTYQQKLKGMAGVESFFSNEGTEVTSYNSGQPSSFFMLGGRDNYYIFWAHEAANWLFCWKGLKCNVKENCWKNETRKSIQLGAGDCSLCLTVQHGF